MVHMYTGTDRKQTQQVSFVLTYFANSTVALCGHSGWVELMLRPDAGRFLCWRSTERENTDRLRWGNQSDCHKLAAKALCGGAYARPRLPLLLWQRCVSKSSWSDVSRETCTKRAQQQLGFASRSTLLTRWKGFRQCAGSTPKFQIINSTLQTQSTEVQ